MSFIAILCHFAYAPLDNMPQIRQNLLTFFISTFIIIIAIGQILLYTNKLYCKATFIWRPASPRKTRRCPAENFTKVFGLSKGDTMKTLEQNRLTLRITNATTIDNINRVLKITKGKSINKVINDALDLALPQMIDTELQTTQSFAGILEKNTNKVISKLNRMQTELKKDNMKTMIMLSSTENLCSFLVNDVLAKMDIPDDLKKSMALTLPSFIREEKENLIKSLFED